MSCQACSPAGDVPTPERIRQDTQAQSLKETGEIFNGWDIIRKQKTTAFMKKGHFPKGNIGNGELAVLPAFFKGCGSTPAEP